jgi:hypothetical protein
VLLYELGQSGGSGLFGREAGDGLHLDLAGLPVGAPALDLHRLHGVREQHAGADGAHLQPADLDAAVAAAVGAIPQRNLPPRQAPQSPAKLILIALHDQDVVSACGDDFRRVAVLGVHRVGGDHGVAQVEAGQYRG